MRRRSGGLGWAGAACGFWAAFGAAGAFGEGGVAEGPAGLLRRVEEGFVAVYEKVAPAVVVVEAKKPKEAGGWPEEFSLKEEGGDFHPLPRGRDWSEGSGFVISPDGEIVTNHHVVAGASELFVRFQDGRRLPAERAGSDERTDIALLRVKGGAFASAVLGDSDAVRVGQIVCAIGAPYELDYSFTCGWVSGVGRTNLTEIGYEDYIQTDAFINPGNSGGPLFDVEGRVVGMNTLIRGVGRGLSFAIPSNLVREVADALAREGRVRRPWIGVRVDTLGRSDLGKLEPGTGARGVVVHTIFRGAPALKSDLRPADILLAVDGVPLGVARDLQREIYRKAVGAAVVLTVRRGNRTLDITVTTAELPEAGTGDGLGPGKLPSPGGRGSGGPHGMELGELPPALGESLGLRGGVLVGHVEPGSPAERAGIHAGDVILSLDRADVRSPEDCGALSGSAFAERGVLVEFDRAGARRYTVLGGEARAE